MVELSNSTVVHGVATGAAFILATILLQALIGAGLVVINDALMVYALWMFWIGVGLSALFGILFFITFDVV
jgi:hypothetical protein